jgi:hypothetical protein
MSRAWLFTGMGKPAWGGRRQRGLGGERRSDVPAPAAAAAICLDRHANWNGVDPGPLLLDSPHEGECKGDSNDDW